MLKKVATDLSIRMSHSITMRKKQAEYYDTAWIENNLLKWKVRVQQHTYYTDEVSKPHANMCHHWTHWKQRV